MVNPTEPGPASTAATHLLTSALLEIRMMASSREVFIAGEQPDPESAFDTDAVARIHMLADTCHRLAGALATPDPAAREVALAESLSWQWSVALPEARRWMANRLAQLGPEYVPDQPEK
ncbi:hypothetical protein GCM10022251_25490 [Phytohabitans flavus]|uniref:Uncharacterized protein n=1 Tax=Phytohabitans flavus TaxID=1076124 RepID=A0A6F8XR13_9ACTN|nr:hypothetical protein [Phytohabitans flavus]BCB76247.1 hypothetical protein Pflav_026570 [Phytohabitans flavus]